MKRPIDPNLNDNFNIDDLGEAEIDLNTVQNDMSSGLTLNERNVEEQQHHHHSSERSHHSHEHHSSHHSSGSHHHSSSHHSKKKKKKKKLSVAAKLAIALLVIILAFVIAIAGTFLYLEHRGKGDLTNVQTQTNYEEVIEYNGHKYVYNKDIVAMAFIGVDKRELGTDGTIGTAGQADTDIVLTVDTNTGRAKALAIPRDTMVDVDLYSENGIFLRTENMQLCLSYAYGDGMASSAQNVTTSVSRILYNVPVNKYFVLDLDGIAPINDAIGGVTVESLFDFDNLGIKKGDTIHLTGDMTETYVRRRDMNTVDASLNRTERQIQYIKAFAAQALPAVINDFGTISRLYNTASSYSSTNMDLSNVTYLATVLLSKGINSFETETLQGNMTLSDKTENENVYAEFHVDEDAVLETVLDTFYTQID